MSAVTIVLVVAAIACVAVWVTSLVTNEHSWVDRIWSIIPVVYVWIFAASAGLANTRLDVMAVLVTLWGARLTFNFARKGGYSGEEDYRWAILRARMPRWQFEIFNLFFIVIYQNAVLLLITFPAYTALEHRSRHFGPLDLLVTVVFVVLLIGETVADQQQWNFHAFKRREAAAGREPHPRFLQTGLFRYSRHPNFFCELGQWFTLFFFGAVAAGSVVQWTIIGPVLLLTIFIGSTSFTESITKSKYPEYADFQARTSALIPWFPGRRSDDTVTG
jgi:steroid 5-alpha reductase family enzyme